MLMVSHRDLAMLCHQSYDEEGIPNAGDPIGAWGPMVFVLAAADCATVVFRGTIDRGGKLLDLLAAQIRAPGVMAGWGRVHAGFLEAWNAVSRQVRVKTAGRRVTLTGHSLGGAMATLAAIEMGPQVEAVVTFGSPRVGDAEFRAGYSMQVPHTTRYVNCLDPVALIPGLIMGWRHVCPATWYDGSGWCSGYSIGAVLRAAWHLCGTWEGMLARLADYHRIEAYVAAMPARESMV